MNPIEHIHVLCDDLEQRINRKGVSSLQQLEEELQIAWDDTSLETCQKLVESFPNRCRNVIKSKGWTNKVLTICLKNDFSINLIIFLSRLTQHIL